MLLNKQLASRSRRPRIAYVFWSLNQEQYKEFVKRFGIRYKIECFDLSDSRIFQNLRNVSTLKPFDVVIDDFSKHPAAKKEAIRDFYDANIARAILHSEELATQDIEDKIQYKTFVNWNLPTQTKKRLLALPEKTLNRLIVKNSYFRNDLMKGMISFDKNLSLKIFLRLSHQTVLDLLMADVEKIMDLHLSSTHVEKEIYISKSCWQHVSPLHLLKAFNAYAWQTPEIKDLDIAAMILNVFQSIILKDESIIRLNDQIEMIQIGVQLGTQFDEVIAHYPWLYFYFKELVVLYKDSGIDEVNRMQKNLESHGVHAHIYRDIIQLVNQLSGSFDFFKLMDLVYNRGYAVEVIEPLLVHLTIRNFISEHEKDQLLYFKKNGFKSLWQKSA